MKKIIGIVAVAAMVASGAFAEITFGAWGRSGMNFVNATTTKNGSNDATTTDPTVAATPGWAGGSRIGFNVTGSTEDGNVGFKVHVDSNGGTIGIGDQAKVWGKIGWLTAEFGKIQVDDLRGSIGDWGNRDIGSKGENDIFCRFEPAVGMALELRPVEGLFIGVVADSSAKMDYTDTPVTSDKMEDVFKAVNAGIGYTVKDAVQVKAAYFGSAIEDDYGRIEVGLDLLMIKNNLVEIGAKLPLFKDDAARLAAKNKDYFSVCAGFSGSADKLSYKGHVFGSSSVIMDGLDYKSLPVAGFDAAGEYDLGLFALGLTAKYQITINSVAKTSKHEPGVELYAKKNLGNGYLFAGVADSLTMTVAETESGSVLKNEFCIPVGAEYWF
jgi:predicted porin